jgi:hypothetical protein
MRRGDLVNDWQDRRKRSAVTALVVILMIGLTLGVALGVVLTRVFDAAQIDELAREFSRPGAGAPVTPETR